MAEKYSDLSATATKRENHTYPDRGHQEQWEVLWSRGG
jgi:hypothetical protein